MKAFVVLAVVIGAALAAPSEKIDDIQRIKKSYGTAPCGTPLAPVALYLSAAPGDIDETEHRVKERSYYNGPASAAVIAAGGAAAGIGAAAASSGAAAGPAVGLFPGAKVGGCAVPLLLSCAPNVHSGYISHAAPAYAAAAPAYRIDAEHSKMREMTDNDHTAKMREMTQPQTSGIEAERSSNLALMTPQQTSWAEAERSASMQATFPQPAWAEAERSSNMVAMFPERSWDENPQQQWMESARAANVPAATKPHHHQLSPHHHHVVPLEIHDAPHA